MSSIRSLQSSTSSRKLLESVRSLRPLLCEALRASGCDTIDIQDQEAAAAALPGGEGLSCEDVQYQNIHDSGQLHDIYAQCLPVQDFANPHPTLPYGGRIRDHDANTGHNGYIHVDMQHCNAAPQSHNYANGGDDTVIPFVDVQHHGSGHYHDTHHQGHGKYHNAAYWHYGNVYPEECEHLGDALHHGDGHYGDANDYGHVHRAHSYTSKSIIMTMDTMPQNLNYCSKPPKVQQYQEQIVAQMSFSNLLPMTREISSVMDVNARNPLQCFHYPKPDNHDLGPAYHHHHLQQHASLESAAFVNTVLLDAPARNEGSMSDEVLLEADTSNKSCNDNNEGVGTQDSSRDSANNIELHEACDGLQARCREAPPMQKLCTEMEKTMSKKLEWSGESKGTDNEDYGNLSSPKGKGVIPSANLFSERKRRKKWNEALYALRALVPIVSKMDKLSIVGDALTYLHELEDKVNNLENDICSLQTEKEPLLQNLEVSSHDGLSTCTSQEMETGKCFPKHKILELDVVVVDVEQKTYHLCIRCEKADLVLLELTKALEALNLNMLNGNIAVTSENQILYTVVVKVDTIEVLTTDMVKESILRSTTMHGFYL